MCSKICKVQYTKKTFDDISIVQPIDHHNQPKIPQKVDISEDTR